MKKNIKLTTITLLCLLTKISISMPIQDFKTISNFTLLEQLNSFENKKSKMALEIDTFLTLRNLVKMSAVVLIEEYNLTKENLKKNRLEQAFAFNISNSINIIESNFLYRKQFTSSSKPRVVKANRSYLAKTTTKITK